MGPAEQGVRIGLSAVVIALRDRKACVLTTPGDATRMTFLLADDNVEAGAWRQVGFVARGPVGGPLVIATVRSKATNDRVFESAKDLVALNVGN